MIPLLPTANQNSALQQWFRDARKTYNLATTHVLHQGWFKTTCTTSFNTMEKEMVYAYVSKSGLSTTKHTKLLCTPKVIRQQAIKSVVAHIKAFRTKVNKRAAQHAKYPNARSFQRPVKFVPGFKSRDMTHDTITIEAKSLRQDDATTFSIYRNWRFKPGGPFVMRDLRYATSVAANLIGRDFRVHYKRGKYVLLLTTRRYVDDHTRQQNPGVDAIGAIDPGVRKFATVYSPQGKTSILGTNTNKVVDKCLRRRDRAKKKLEYVTQLIRRTKSTLCTMKGKETGAFTGQTVDGRHLTLKRVSVRDVRKKLRNRVWRAKRRYREAEAKTTNVIKDMHYKVAHHLLSHYNTLILPNTSAHHWRKGHRLHRTVKRRSQALSFGKFASRLVETATWYPTTRVLRGSEAYTSKQCGRCGTLNDKLGGSEIFKCNECGATADRDVHAARNILLRFMQ